MPSKKKIKLEPKSAKSRLMQICDSSSDEEEVQQMSVDEDEVPIKKAKENKTPSPKTNQQAVSKASGTNCSNSNGKRRTKVKKMVTRTYEDEDGFISEYNATASHTRSILIDFNFSHCRYCTGNGRGQLFRR